MKATESRTESRVADTSARSAKDDKDEKDEKADKADKAEHVTQTAGQQDRTRNRTRQAKVDAGECVVDDGTAHMGRATPGAVICSAHAMHYKADGTPRSEDVNR